MPNLRPSPSKAIAMDSVFQDNPYFTAGFGLLGVGAGLTVLRQGTVRLASLLQRRYMASLEINSRDPSYFWVLQWLTRNNLRTGSHFSVHTTRSDTAMHSSLVPSPGLHYLRWNGKWIKIQREREKAPAVDIGGAGSLPFETIRLSVIGPDHQIFMKILEEARAEAAAQTEGKLMLYTSFAAEWRPFGNPRRRRPIKSVILDDGLADTIMNDVQEFLNSSKWYLDRGIPYRRGYLLYGPPGTGKSSFIQALASELGYSICILNLADGMVTDDRLHHLFNAMPPKSILLLEDIDAVGLDTSGSPSQGFQKLTLSGLLNALDGVGSSEERMVFMTTNHYERLAPALIRPGRIDMKLCIGLATANQSRQMFMRFYPGQSELADSFASVVAESHLSPATIQGHFIQHKDNPQEAVEQIKELASAKDKFING